MTLKALTFLKLSAITSKIGNYFWHKHVQELRKQQYKLGLRP
jgi:hypothetical protein